MLKPIKIKRLDKTLPLPEYHTPGAVAFDLYARKKIVVAPGALAKIPANIIVAVPPGFMLLIKNRSSCAQKKGLFCMVGYIDQDYCGENDEILLEVYNFTNKPSTVKKGERIGQAALVPIAQTKWVETNKMNKTSRGGFGSTG